MLVLHKLHVLQMLLIAGYVCVYDPALLHAFIVQQSRFTSRMPGTVLKVWRPSSSEVSKIAMQVAAFQCLQPFVGSVLAFAVLGEEPSIWDLGAIGVIFGLILVAKDPSETTAMLAKLRHIVRPTDLQV